MCGSSPEAPDLSEQAAASKLQAELSFKMQGEQLDWAREQFDRSEQLMNETLGVQTSIMKEQWEAGKKDRARYEDTFQPLEDRQIAEAVSYDTPERRELERGRAQAQVQQSFDGQRENAQRRLESYGIDPSQTRSQAIDSEARVSMAAQQAAAANMSDQNVENKGRALVSNMINVGRGMPGQSNQSYAGAVGAGNAAVGNSNATVQQGANTMGTGQSWGAQGLSANQQGANIINSGFQNELAAYDASGGALGGVGQVAGTALGVAGAMGYAEGGAVANGNQAGIPVPGVDVLPAMLAKDEYVVPADIVKRKGTEFFDKLVDKTREGIPTTPGAGNDPEPQQAVGA